MNNEEVKSLEKEDEGEEEEEGGGEEIESTLSSSIHLLPCNIDYNGPAPIKTFFKINKKDNNIYEAQLRGRGLIGKEINVSDYCKGIYISDDKSKMHIEGEFNSLIFWQHGMEPDVQQIENNLAWFELAKDLHS